MSMNNLTGDEISMAIEATRKSLEQDSLRESIMFQIAADHNLHRKIVMIDSAMGLYRHLHHAGPMPEVPASVAFNPNLGKDATNIHYIFKELLKGMPWEIHREYLIKPTALTLVLFDMLDELFPSSLVTHAKMRLQRFIHLWSKPVYRPEETKEELARQRLHYFHEMEEFETTFRKLYEDLSEYFRRIEAPEKNPIVKEIDETYKNTKAISAKVCGKEKSASFVAQKRALEIWTTYKTHPEVKTKYSKKRHRITYSDVFDYCKRELKELQFTTPLMFEKAVKSAQKRTLGK